MTKRQLSILLTILICSLFGCSYADSHATSMKYDSSEIMDEMILVVHSPRYDAKEQRLIGSATIQNNGTESFPIVTDGDVGSLPQITPVSVECEQLIANEWTNITRMYDGIGVVYHVSPREKLDFEFGVSVNRTITQHDIVRIVYSGLTSNAFQIDSTNNTAPLEVE